MEEDTDYYFIDLSRARYGDQIKKELMGRYWAGRDYDPDVEKALEDKLDSCVVSINHNSIIDDGILGKTGVYDSSGEEYCTRNQLQYFSYKVVDGKFVLDQKYFLWLGTSCDYYHLAISYLEQIGSPLVKTGKNMYMIKPPRYGVRNS